MWSNLLVVTSTQCPMSLATKFSKMAGYLSSCFSNNSILLWSTKASFHFDINREVTLSCTGKKILILNAGRLKNIDKTSLSKLKELFHFMNTNSNKLPVVAFCSSLFWYCACKRFSGKAFWNNFIELNHNLFTF